MLLKAAKDFNIDLSQSWMVGDGENDIIAGFKAGCKSVLVNDENNNLGQTASFGSLLDFVNSVLKR
jgi:D-glycero-D-manno-heptose 1,7-bisphosphate phosphatase